MKPDVKRKLVTGSLETLLGLGVLIFSWLKGVPLLYMGALLAGSGVFTLLICALRIFADKKQQGNETNAGNGKASIGKTIYNTVIMIIVTAVVVVAGIFVYKFIKGSNTPPPESGLPSIVQLDTPKQVSFDNRTYVLSWNAVENASAYIIYYNGTETTVDNSDAREQITIIAQENVFKVKAVGDGAYYSDSEWSQEVTYVMGTQQGGTQQEQLSVFDKVNLKLAEAAQSKGLTLEKIIGISFISLESGNPYGKHIEFETICTNNKGVLNSICISFKNDGYTSSIEELLTHFESATVAAFYYNKNIADYDSAYYLLYRGMQNNDPFDGKMEELRQQGYTITEISSVTLKGVEYSLNKFQFWITGTYKATLGDDVKYFTSTNRITVLNASSAEDTNYETFVLSDEYSTVKETEYIEHEAGGTLLYMGEWAVKNNVNSEP